MTEIQVTPLPLKNTVIPALTLHKTGHLSALNRLHERFAISASGD